MPPADLTIRIAGAADLASIAALRREWSDGTADPGFDGRLAEWWAAEGARRTIWLATVGERPAGMVTLVEYRRMPRPGSSDSAWGYLGHLFVSEADRRRGIGTELIAAVVATAQDRGYARLVLAPSDEAVGVFRRAGFTEPGEDAGVRLLVRKL